MIRDPPQDLTTKTFFRLLFTNADIEPTVPHFSLNRSKYACYLGYSCTGCTILYIKHKSTYFEHSNTGCDSEKLVAQGWDFCY